MIIILALPSVRRFIRYINIPPVALSAIVATVGAKIPRAHNCRLFTPRLPTYLPTYLLVAITEPVLYKSWEQPSRENKP
jgi:hypothetical protein